jgi:hypothetical protein
MPGSTLVSSAAKAVYSGCGGKQGVALSQRVCTVSAPTVVRRVVHQGGTHGVGLDITLAQQSIGVFLHQ